MGSNSAGRKGAEHQEGQEVTSKEMESKMTRLMSKGNRDI